MIFIDYLKNYHATRQEIKGMTVSLFEIVLKLIVSLWSRSQKEQPKKIFFWRTGHINLPEHLHIIFEKTN